MHEYSICHNTEILKKELNRRQAKLTQQEIDLALISAAFVGNLDGVKLLVDKGANIKAVDGNYEDAMSLAAMSQQTEIVRFLLDCGAPPNEANVHHYTPLVHACYYESIDLVNLLLRHIHFNGCCQSINPRCDEENPDIPLIYTYSNKMRPFPWHTPLIVAVYKKNVELVKILLKADVPINESDVRGDTALHHAVWKYDPVIMDSLLESNPDPNMENCRGNTPLLIACKFSKKDDVLLKLIKYGADVNASAKRNMGLKTSVLFEAAAYGSIEVIEALCEAGADLDFIAYTGHTPLFVAIRENNIEAIKVLIQYGCRLGTDRRMPTSDLLEVKNIHLGHAVDKQNLEIIKLLYAVGDFTCDVLHKCLVDEKLRTVLTILKFMNCWKSLLLIH